MNAVFAVNSIDGFGTGTDMPWPRSRQDLQRFKSLTTGNTVVMGSGTWLSNMSKPLPNRRNIVLSSNIVDDRCEVFRNINELMMNISQDEKVFVIGGSKLLWTLRNYINSVFLTRFFSSQNCDIKLDTREYLQNFKLISSEKTEDHVFEIYQRTSII